MMHATLALLATACLAAAAPTQMHLHLDTAKEQQQPLVIDASALRNLAPQAGAIQFSRTVKLGPDVAGSVTIDKGCSSSDQYGSNDCELDWGSDYSITVNGTIKKAFNTGETAAAAHPPAMSVRPSVRPCTM